MIAAVLRRAACRLGLHAWIYAQRPRLGLPPGPYRICDRCGMDERIIR